MEEAQDEPLFCERAAGIDIGKQSVMVTVRVPGETRKGGRAQETREFGTTRRQLLDLAGWLRSHGVKRAGMESTSDCWKPVFFLLEQQGLECVLYQASKVKAQPGRPKTDKLDSVWLAKVTERGSGAGSFVPPEDIRRLRACTRYRRRLAQAMTAEKQRVEKLLEDAHLKLSSVISDVHGVSGAEMLRAVAAGERSPRVLAEMARGVMRRKLAALREALGCSFFTEEHAFVLSMMPGNTGHYTRQVAQLDQIPGFGVKTAQDLTGETGVDMGAFPTAGHLCSWARVAPRPKESGGRRKGGSATGKGSPYIGAALGEAAVSTGRAQTFLGARLRRLVRHMPKKKAQVAVMRTQLVAAHALLSDPEAEYAELGPGYYDERAGTARQARGHVRSLEHLGWKVTLEPLDPDTGELTAQAG